MEGNTKACTYCHAEFRNFREFHRHYSNNHSTVEDLIIPCGVFGCNRTFKKFSTLRSHLSRDHNNLIRSNQTARHTRDISTNDDDDDDGGVDDGGDDDGGDDDGGDDDDGDDDDGDDDDDVDDGEQHDPGGDNNGNPDRLDAQDDLFSLADKMAIAHFILEIRAKSNCSEDLVVGFLRTIQEVVTFNVERTLEKVSTKLRDSVGIHLNDHFDIETELRSIDCNMGLDTIYKQNKFFVERFGLILPKRQRLGDEFVINDGGVVGANQPIRLSRDEMIVIPIMEVLNEWFENEDFTRILQKSMRARETKPDILSSDKDGTYLYNHEFFRAHPEALRVKLYFDEVEVCDPLGSKAGKQKLGMIYFQLENVGPMYNSKLSFINLIGIVKNTHIKKYGMNRILEPFVEEVKKLQDGFDTPMGRMHAGLYVIEGHNLAVHQMCGFKEGFTAHRPCRQCNATLNEVRTMTEEDRENLRTPEEHDRQVEALEGAEGNDEERLTVEYGVTRGSVLNDLEGFHVTTGAPAEIVHDSLEGWVKDNTKGLMNVYIDEKIITLDELNDKIASFDYGYSEKESKPSPIKAKHLQKSGNLRQSASQMWLLAITLPLMLANAVPEDCPFMANYIRMLEILSICTAHEIHTGMLDYLADVIQQYLEDYKNLFKDDINEDGLKNLTPKQHYLVHYPRLLKTFGPLVRFWAMRLEAEHQYFKRIVQAMRNYKNLPLTLARIHQLLQAFVLYGSLKNKPIVGPRKIIDIHEVDFAHLFPGENELETFNWIKLCSTKYIPKRCYIPIGFDEGECFPIFGELHAILLVDSVPLFVCKRVRTVEHNMKLLAYRIETDNDFVTYKIRDLFSYQVFHSHRSNNQNFLIVKQMLGGRLH